VTFVSTDVLKKVHIDGAGLSSLGVPGVPWHPQILADQLTLSKPRGADYAHQIILDFQTFRRLCSERLLSVHAGKNPFRCDICDYIFSKNSNLTKHIASVHDEIKPFKCDICEKNFSQKFILQEMKIKEIS
jgi:uncharacterized Zn-finger protein